MADVKRREFFKITGATLAGSSLALLGFSPGAALAEVREFKLSRATETRNTCPYCSVACGVIMYSLGDRAKNADGATVNRWLTTGMLAASASSNEVGYVTHKVIRSFGILAFDNQARV